MIRTQIQLSEEHFRRLRRLARAEGVSVAEIVRRCIARFFEKETESRAKFYERAAGIVGSFKDLEGAADVATDHDRYLEDSFR